MKTIKHFVALFILAGLFTVSTKQAKAHCEIPCGIYGDSVRVALIYEHISTIEKSMKMIIKLSEAEKPDYNQLVRWVMNKEEHAKKIQDIVSQYFLHQRIKPKSDSDDAAYRKYVKQLESLHHILIFAMKSKQGTDLNVIEKMRDKVHIFEHAYFANHKH